MIPFIYFKNEWKYSLMLQAKTVVISRGDSDCEEAKGPYEDVLFLDLSGDYMPLFIL